MYNHYNGLNCQLCVSNNNSYQVHLTQISFQLNTTIDVRYQARNVISLNPGWPPVHCNQRGMYICMKRLFHIFCLCETAYCLLNKVRKPFHVSIHRGVRNIPPHSCQL
jgi:hypothetical protein